MPPAADLRCPAPLPFFEQGFSVLATLQASASTDASPERFLSSWRSVRPFSGHGSTATMQQHQTPFRFIVQVSSETSRFCKKSKDVYVLLLPCPKALFSLICDYVHVLKLLFMSGDVELNPGPPKEDNGKQYNELVTLIRSLHTKVDTKHEEVMASLAEVKQAQLSLEQQIVEIDKRLCS